MSKLDDIAYNEYCKFCYDMKYDVQISKDPFVHIANRHYFIYYYKIANKKLKLEKLKLILND